MSNHDHDYDEKFEGRRENEASDRPPEQDGKGGGNNAEGAGPLNRIRLCDLHLDDDDNMQIQSDNDEDMEQGGNEHENLRPLWLQNVNWNFDDPQEIERSFDALMRLDYPVERDEVYGQGMVDELEDVRDRIPVAPRDLRPTDPPRENSAEEANDLDSWEFDLLPRRKKRSGPKMLFPVAPQRDSDEGGNNADEAYNPNSWEFGLLPPRNVLFSARDSDEDEDGNDAVFYRSPRRQNLYRKGPYSFVPMHVQREREAYEEERRRYREEMEQEMRKQEAEMKNGGSAEYKAACRRMRRRLRRFVRDQEQRNNGRSIEDHEQGENNADGSHDYFTLSSFRQWLQKMEEEDLGDEDDEGQDGNDDGEERPDGPPLFQNLIWPGPNPFVPLQRDAQPEERRMQREQRDEDMDQVEQPCPALEESSDEDQEEHDRQNQNRQMDDQNPQEDADISTSDTYSISSDDDFFLN